MDSEARPSFAEAPCLFRICSEGWVSEYKAKRATGWWRAAAFPAAGDKIILPNGDSYEAFEVAGRVFAATGGVSLTIYSHLTHEATEHIFAEATKVAGVEC